MKLTTGTLSAACLAVFSVFAASTPAQQPQPYGFGDKFHLTRQPADSQEKIAAQAAVQQKLKDDATPTGATDDCSYTFTSGTGDAYLQFCVTVNGNIAEFQSPEGVEQIRQGSVGEGYGVCDESTQTSYEDFAEIASSNWNAPVLVSQTATMVKIERTTTDNLFILTQIITMVPGTPPYARVEMQLKNNSSGGKQAILVRWADSDPDNATADGYSQNLDSTNDSAFAWISYDSGSGNDPYGLMIQNAGNPSVTNTLRAGFAYPSAMPPNPCSVGIISGSPVLDTDGSIAYAYDLEMREDQTVTVFNRYVRF